ncbi:hypothetical protein BGX30_006236 [Mortierella sp. GBA39]|nr:hypothetical protein BGX30_006236 [Mortierella sp. GBA39]
MAQQSLPSDEDQSKHVANARQVDHAETYPNGKRSPSTQPGDERDSLKCVEAQAVQPNNVAMEPHGPALVNRNPDSRCKRQHHGYHGITDARHQLRMSRVYFATEILRGQEQIKDDEEQGDGRKNVAHCLVKGGPVFDKPGIDPPEILYRFGKIGIQCEHDVGVAVKGSASSSEPRVRDNESRRQQKHPDRSVKRKRALNIAPRGYFRPVHKGPDPAEGGQQKSQDSGQDQPLLPFKPAERRPGAHAPYIDHFH